MDYDFITTCNWTATGNYNLTAYRGSTSNVMGSWYTSIYYRKKGTTSWTTVAYGGVVSITSTGEWEIANDWNKSGDNCLCHSYSGITAIDKCTNFYINATSLGSAAGYYFMYRLFCNCSNLALLPSGFNIPSTITSSGGNIYFELSFCNTALNNNSYTENLTFRKTGSDTFLGTSITPVSPAGSAETPVNVAVNRYVEPTPYIRINIGDTWKTVESMKINIGDTWKDVDLSGSKINIGDTWKDLSV